MTDLSLEDLAGSAGETAESASETAESGESLMELVEFMDERGYLEPLMFGLNNDETETETVEPSTENAPSTDGEGVPLTAGNIERLAATIQQRVGDVPISRIESFAAENPEKVNSLIAQLEDE